MLKEIIENGRFSFQKGSLSWEEAIKKACQPLLEQKIIEPEYPGYIISNVHEFGPYIVIAPEGFVRFFKNVPVHTIEFYGILIASIVTIICTALLFNYKHHLHSHSTGNLKVAK